MIKILLFADTHLGFDHPVRKDSVRPRRGVDFFNNFKRILTYALEQKVDLLIHGGDFFFRSKVPPKIVTEAYEILFQFAEKGIPIVIVPGNHERSILPDSFLTRHPNIHIFSEPGRFSFNLKYKQFDIFGIPFVRNNVEQKFPRIIQDFRSQINPSHYNLLCLHQAIEGSRVEKYTFRKGADVISFNDIPIDFDAVLSGHIHRKQVIWKKFDDKRVPIIYPGSIERTSFAERNEYKGFYLLTFEEEKKQLSDIKFQTLPARNMVEIQIPTNINSGEELKNFLRSRTYELPLNSIIRFRGIKPANEQFFSLRILPDIIPSSMIIQYRSASKRKSIKLRKNN